MRARPREWQVPFGKTRESGSFYSISGSSATARIPEQSCGVRDARRSCGVLIRRSLVFSHCVVSDDDAARY
jgi:hypothetical protein